MSNPYGSPLDIFDRFDLRDMRQMSNDDNQPDGNMRLINRLLDSAASELESSLYGLYGLPIIIGAGSISGAVAVNGLTFTCTQVPTGIYLGSRIVIGPDASTAPGSINPPEIVQIENITGSVPNLTITITGSGQSQAGMAGGFSFPHNANAPIGIMPPVLTDFVCTIAGDKIYGRRTKRPEGLDKDVKAKREWLDQLRNGIVTIPGLDRATQPTIFGARGVPWSTPGCNFGPGYAPWAWFQCW